MVKNNKDPIIFRTKRTLGQRAADKLTNFAGSWTFIFIFFLFLGIWMLINTYFLIRYELGKPWDNYPFILLNLILSCLAAVQAPVILMAQNRESQRDRLRAKYDYNVDKKAEKEIQEIKKQLDRIEKGLYKK
jgi:uncharacterized membrane protein